MGESEPIDTRASSLLDLDILLKLRLVVARFGEMDRAGWWNTRGQLGPMGATVLRRGFARTHQFAQARSVFAVAGHRCAEIFDPPNSVTLWRRPSELEEAFDARWEHWLDHAADWAPFFEQLAELNGNDLIADMRSFDLIGDGQVEDMQGLKRSAEGRSLQVPGTFSGTNDDVTLLALGFSKGAQGTLTVPWMRRAEA